MTTTENRPSVDGPARPRHADTAGDPDAQGAFDFGLTAAIPRVRDATVIPGTSSAPTGARRGTGGRPPGDLQSMCFAALAGLSAAVLLFGLVGPLSGRLGFVIVAWCGFVLTYGVLVAVENNGVIVRDRVMTVVFTSIAALLFLGLVTVVLFVVVRGISPMTHVNFFTSDQSETTPTSGLEVGGILHAIVGSLIMMSICLVITIPIGITCSVFLAVVKGPGSRFVRTVVEAMTALPSIVAGLFIYATWVLTLGAGKSGLAASLALSVMMLPIIIRAADVVLRLVPGTLLEASEALGAPRWRTVLHIVLPTSKSGLATAVILGTARGIGETSPVLLTAGVSQSTNWNPFQGPMLSLPLATFLFQQSGQPNLVARGFGTAATLLVLVMVLFFLARVIGGRGAGQLNNRQRRRRARQSAADGVRFNQRDVDASTSGSEGGGLPSPALQGPVHSTAENSS